MGCSTSKSEIVRSESEVVNSESEVVKSIVNTKVVNPESEVVVVVDTKVISPKFEVVSSECEVEIVSPESEVVSSESEFVREIALRGFFFSGELRPLGYGINGAVSIVSKGGRDFALKVIQSHESDFEKVRYLDELIKELPKDITGCPFLVKFEDVSKNLKDQVIYVIMELCSNESKEFVGNLLQFVDNFDYSKDFPLEEKGLMKIIIQLLLGLSVLHDHKIIHRNIKPRNVFIMEDYAKLGDYLLKEKLDVMWESGEATNNDLIYVAPEIFNREKTYGFPADVWSMGLVFYCLCTGKLPPYSGVGKYPQGCPRRVCAMIKKMRNGNPTERPTVRELLADHYVKKIAVDLKLDCYYPQGL